MASSDSDNQDIDYVFYKDRPEWNDITPLPQNDGPHPVVQIAYTDMFKDVYDYFRAIVAKGELSERALYLTEEAIQMNAANYTVWQYRRKIIKEIGHDLEEELDFCRQMIEINPKNYQVWHHRRVIVESLGDPSKELLLTKIIFSNDPKNYHAWEHRQWVLKTYDIYHGELDYIDNLLADDIRNNSAWNHRYFVISRTSGFSDDVINNEITYAQTHIEKLINNESPWNYLKGILAHSSGKKIEFMVKLENWAWELYNNGEEEKGKLFLIMFLVDLLEEKMELNKNNNHLNQVLDLCDNLGQKQDRIRKQYWTYTANRLKQKFISPISV